MEQLTFTCETITPMFCYGADGETPEIRAQSIKGALRFWWRAMQGDSNTIDLYKREAAIFGAPNEDIGKSKIHIRVKNNGFSGSKLEHFLPDRNKSGRSLEGIKYLLYSVHSMRSKKGIPPEQEFTLIMNGPTQDVDSLIKAIWAFSIFGGIGSRSRRGGGNFRILHNTNDKRQTLFDLSKIKEKNELIDYVKTNFNGVLPKTKNNTYSTLKDTRILIFDPSKEWFEALEKIAFPFKEFRQNHKGDVFLTPSFGFPIIHGIRNPPRSTYLGSGKRPRETMYTKIERRSSPLIFRIIKTDNNTFFPVLLYIEANLLPPGFKIIKKEEPIKNAKPDDSLVKTFLDDMSKRPECSEIKKL